MLGDCYAAAIVEELSRKELMACEAVSYYHENSPRNSNEQISPSGIDKKDYMPELIVVEMSSTDTKDKTYQI